MQTVFDRQRVILSTLKDPSEYGLPIRSLEDETKLQETCKNPKMLTEIVSPVL